MLDRILELFHRLIKVFIHDHLTVSLAMVAVVSVLSGLSFFERLESATYRLAAGIELPYVGNTAALAQGPELIPRVLLISGEMYETDFHQRSPLDRTTLAGVLDKVLMARPRILVVDLDISPAIDPGQDRLDRLLIEASQHTQIVLATPFPVESPKLKQEKLLWIKKLCAGGVHFGLPTLHSTDGMVLRYDPATPALAQVAAAVLDAKETTGIAQEPHNLSAEQLPPSGNSIAASCDKAMDAGVEGVDFLDTLYYSGMAPEGFSIKRLKLINANYFAPGLAKNISTVSSLADIPGEKDLSGRVVFLGGQYGLDDRLETLNGELYGVVVHSAIFYSLTHPLKELPGWICHTVDIGLIAVMGWLFEKLWRTYYRNHYGYMHLQHAKTDKERRMRSIAFGRSVLTLLGVLIASLLALWLLLIATTIALRQGIQFSMAYMGFSMLVYCLFVNRKEAIAQDIRLKFQTLRQKIVNPVEGDISPVVMIDKHLASTSPAPPSDLRALILENWKSLHSFLLVSWFDLRFVILSVRRAPLISVMALGELIKNWIPFTLVLLVAIKLFFN